MNAERVKLWIAALRSGISQCKGQLRKGDSRCCLGVACDVYREHVGGEWKDEFFIAIDRMRSSGCLPYEVAEWFDLAQDPYLSGAHATAYNDSLGKSLPEIADIIEAELAKEAAK